MPRTPWILASFVATAVALSGLIVGSVVACGDLVIPQEGDDDGGDPVDAPLDGNLPVNCDAGIPTALACTGLYSDWTYGVLAPDVHAYQPGATMWVDGATSLRWIWLPPGSKIDTTDPNNWVFPVGTKIWQELTILGKKIETRFAWKEAPSLWFRTTYAWSDDQRSAPQLTLGLPNARGLPYEIPAVAACEKCHNGANDFVLGFEAVGLSMPQSSGLNMQALKTQNLLTKLPTAGATIPGDMTTAGALAFLHANCGTSCHNRNVGAQAGSTGLFTKLSVDANGALPGTAAETDTWLTAYKVPSTFTPGSANADAAAPAPTTSATTTPPPPAGDAAADGAAGTDGSTPAPAVTTPAPAPTTPIASAPGFYRLWPGDPVRSMIPWRAGRRDGVTQMPPIATHVVDQNDVALLSSWVRALPP